jgi:V/A-type H+-transporting ATPase subunit E
VAQQYEDKMKRFEHSMMRRAYEQRSSILKEVEALEARELERERRERQTRAKQRVEGELGEVEAQSRREMSHKIRELRKMLVEAREALVEDLFSDARRRLEAFSASGRPYEEYLLKKVRLLAGRCTGDDCQLLIRREDAPLIAQIEKAFGRPCLVMATEDLSVGGIILYSQESGLILDESLDAALAEQRRLFMESSALYADAAASETR